MYHKIFIVMRQEYAHAQRSPPFWMVHSNQFIDFTVNFVLQKTGELAVAMVAFACIFGWLKIMNMQNNSVGRIVYYLMMYEWGSWM